MSDQGRDRNEALSVQPPQSPGKPSLPLTVTSIGISPLQNRLLHQGYSEIPKHSPGKRSDDLVVAKPAFSVAIFPRRDVVFFRNHARVWQHLLKMRFSMLSSGIFLCIYSEKRSV